MTFKAIAGKTRAIRLDNIRTQMNAEFQKQRLAIRAHISDDGHGITIRRSTGSELIIEKVAFKDSNNNVLNPAENTRSEGTDHGINGESTVGRKGSDVHIFSRNGRHNRPRPLTEDEQKKSLPAQSKARYGMVPSAKYVSTY